VIGFSAGGWVTNHIAISPDASLRPAFAVSAYSGHDESWNIPANAPPMFIVAADDDRYTTDGGLGIYKLWRKAHIPVEMHIYAKGDHGFALRKQGLPVDSWNERLRDWLASLGFLKPANP
jgi:dienelactone hydrolase